MPLFSYEVRTLSRLVERGFTPKVIYDIGASNGVWSDTVALAVPEAAYFLFEPLAEAVPFYRKDLAERLERRPNFRLDVIALSNRNGDAEMFATHDGFGSSMLDRGAIPEVKEHVSVPMWTLDEFAARNSLPAPDVMKLDVQGAERLILDGASKALESTGVLFMETWLTRGYGPETPLLTEMVEFLQARGFMLVDFGEQFRDEKGRIYSVDAVFCSDGLITTLPAS